MIFIQVEGMAGDCIRDKNLGEMLNLAETTGAAVRMNANGCKFTVYPGDSLDQLKAAFDRLYPHSWLISQHTHHPVQKPAALAEADVAPAQPQDRFQVRPHPSKGERWVVWDTKWSRRADPSAAYTSKAMARKRAHELNARHLAAN